MNRIVRVIDNQTPIAALQLAEDSERILAALHSIQRIDPESINKDRHKGYVEKANLIHSLKDWHAQARKKLLTNYLRVEARKR